MGLKERSEMGKRKRSRLKEEEGIGKETWKGTGEGLREVKGIGEGGKGG